MLYNEYLKCKKPYQEQGADFLLRVKHGCLFYKPGKGKTYPTIDAAREVWKQYPGMQLLVLSTADAIKNMWLAEIKPQHILPEDAVYMSFTKAIQEADTKYLLKHKWNVIIVDESHKVKSCSTKISRLLHRLSKNCEYVWGLTGTPRGNTDVDIFAQLHNLNVSEWGTISYTNFVNMFCDTVPQYTPNGIIRKPTGINARCRVGWEKNLATYTQRIDYCDEDEMPPIDVNAISLPYEKTKEYLDALDGVLRIDDYESTMTKLSAITKLHEVCNGFLYYQDLQSDERVTFVIGHNDKVDWIKENVRPGTTIVYRFGKDFENIVETLDTMGLTHTESVEDYKSGKAQVLVLQCSRCESFNLQQCHHMVFYTLDYSYIKYNQMLHRIWRTGQKDAVRIDVLLFKDTVEDNIWEAVRSKEKLADLFMRIKGD